MYMRALQGYEDALGVEHVKTYIPALNTMRNLGNLYSETQPDKSQAMYAKALSGYTIVRGGASDICLYLKRRFLDISSRQNATSLRLGASLTGDDSSDGNKLQRREGIFKKRKLNN